MDSLLTKTCVDISTLSDEELNILALKAKDWNIMHGVSMRTKENYSNDIVQIAPFLLLPTCYPRKQFELAKEIQTIFNELMHKVAYDYEFLKNTLKSTIKVDTFTAKLFDIYETVYSEGLTPSVSLGLLRSDYMLHSNEGNKVKQVEINTISVSFGGLTGLLSEYHKFILSQLGHNDKLINIPENNTAWGLANGLVEAWKVYNNKEAVILFVVEDPTYNICDQRAIEFKIYETNPKIRVIRRSLTDLISKKQLASNKTLFVDNLEIGVIYYRDGYQIEAYPTEKEWDVRLTLERSKAIKCPSIQYHLAGTKKVQQELAVPGVLEKFISDSNKLVKMKDVFMGLYSLDLNEGGEKAMAMAMKDPTKYVLKPQREGGGNNIYNEAIKTHIELFKKTKDMSAWILMEQIYPPLQPNYVIRTGSEELKSNKLQKFVSEFGVYGVILGDQERIMLNAEIGHVLRTKPASADEGGIISGAGALDGPYLVD